MSVVALLVAPMILAAVLTYQGGSRARHRAR